MAQYMLLLRGDHEEFESLGADQLQVIMQQYVDWTEKLHREGRFQHGESLLPGSQTLRVRGDRPVRDGPYTETKEAVGGYYVIQASNEDEAVEVAKDCPVFSHGGLVEIREIEVFTDLPSAGT